MLTVLTIQANATTMCATNDSVAIVLDPTIQGTQHGSDSLIRTWWAQFPYGQVQGISTCLAKGGSRGYAEAQLKDTNGELVIGIENNGGYCWCKLTHPVSSVWGYGANASSASSCSSCPGYCADYFRNDYSVRAALYNSISN